MVKKSALWIIGVLCAVNTSLGLIGLYENKMNDTSAPTADYKIKYIYYLDDIEVNKKPENTNISKKEYEFNRYSCTNSVEGKWDDKTWNFIPVLTNNATCKLYFNKAFYNLEFEVEYGELRKSDGKVLTETEKEKPIEVNREQNYVAKIIPDEGYSLNSVECSEKNLTDWDKDNNELTVKNVKSNTKCTVKFEKSSYEVDIKVANGTGATTLTAEHGKDINVPVSATVGYGNPDVKCSNNQIGVWQNNKFTIEKITSTTECKVEFKLLTYEIKIEVSGGTSTPSSNSVNYNGSKEFKITPSEGFVINEGFGVTGCTNGNLDYSNETLVLRVNDVRENTTCKVTLKAKETSSMQ